VRWQARDAAAGVPAAEPSTEALERPPDPPEGLRLGLVQSLWTGRETEYAPALRFLAATQRAQLSAADAGRLGVSEGDEVVVGVDGESVRATAVVRTGVPEGSVFLIEGSAEASATALASSAGQSVEVRRAGTREAAELGAPQEVGAP
jgi:formylmethanofuran dehydrogenase subunit D